MARTGLVLFLCWPQLKPTTSFLSMANSIIKECDYFTLLPNELLDLILLSFNPMELKVLLLTCRRIYLRYKARAATATMQIILKQSSLWMLEGNVKIIRWIKQNYNMHYGSILNQYHYGTRSGHAGVALPQLLATAKPKENMTVA